MWTVCDCRVAALLAMTLGGSNLGRVLAHLLSGLSDFESRFSFGQVEAESDLTALAVPCAAR